MILGKSQLREWGIGNWKWEWEPVKLPFPPCPMSPCPPQFPISPFFPLQLRTAFGTEIIRTLVFCTAVTAINWFLGCFWWLLG